MTTKAIAKPIVKNKYWIVEDERGKLGTVQVIDETGGVAWVSGTTRRIFPSIAVLSHDCNIRFDQEFAGPVQGVKHEVYGFPTDCEPHNQVMDVLRGLPIFAKHPRSKSLHCAGYYVINETRGGPQVEFCPKLITINRHRYQGPFASLQQAQQALSKDSG